jgi:hypothetical protein
MAGLYVILGKASEDRLKRIGKYLRHSSENEVSESGDVSFIWLAFDSAERFAPAHDPHTQVRVISAGQLVYPESEWKKASLLPFQGGLANRIVLERYLSGGTNAVAPFNGAACIVIWDPRNTTLHTWTDQFGYHPVYKLQSESDNLPSVITTFPDAITEDTESNCELDEVSIAEFLRAWRVTPPFTYYRNLLHIGAAAHISSNIRTGELEKKTYWQPFEGHFYKSIDDAARDLSSALKLAVSERTAAADKPCFFVSGGADSRVMLFGADCSSKATGVNIYETEPTPESKTAEALCRRAGANFLGFGRDNDYYPRMLAENVRWSGGMWSTEDSHYLGLKHVVDSLNADLVMTACTTDWVFKGYGLEKTWKKLFGRCLPFKEFLPERQDSFLPNEARPAPPNLRAEIEHRFNNWFEGCPRKLQTDLDYLRVEDRRIRPACYTVSVSGQMMYRVFPYNTFLADSRVANCYSQIPAWMKLNGQVWGKAASLVCTGAGDIVDSNHGWSVNANAFEKILAFSRGWLERRVAKILPKSKPKNNRTDHPSCYASWPDYGWYVKNSPTVQNLWNSTDPEVRNKISTAWGSDPWELELKTWAQTPLDFFRMLTAISFLMQHSKRHP